ncbi:unnamed protein product [Prunus brigantina]
MDAGDEGPEVVGLAVAFEVESEAGETLLGKENWGGFLEGPSYVVVVAVDHEDEATLRGEECQDSSSLSPLKFPSSLRSHFAAFSSTRAGISKSEQHPNYNWIR